MWVTGEPSRSDNPKCKPPRCSHTVGCNESYSRVVTAHAPPSIDGVELC